MPNHLVGIDWPLPLNVLVGLIPCWSIRKTFEADARMRGRAGQISGGFAYRPWGPHSRFRCEIGNFFLEATMARGRKPNPVQLKVLRGNPGRRRLTASSPLFVAGIPPKPTDLDSDASLEWDRLTRELAGVLCVADYGILRVAVDAYSMFVQAQRAIKKHGATYETTNSEGGRMIRQRPEVRILEQSRRAYAMALQEFGATPAQHSRVSPLPSGEEPNGIAKFFESPRPRRG